MRAIISVPLTYYATLTGYISDMLWCQYLRALLFIVIENIDNSAYISVSLPYALGCFYYMNIREWKQSTHYDFGILCF